MIISSLMFLLGCQHVLLNYGGHSPYPLLHVLHILNGGVEGRWLLLLGYFGHIKNAPGPLAEQELERGELGGGLRSLPNGKEHIRQEQVPVPVLLIQDSSDNSLDSVLVATHGLWE